MAVMFLPDAQDDMLSLQTYMLNKWGAILWLQAENDIFDKLEQVDAGSFPGIAAEELVLVGIHDYKSVITSHHRLVYRRHDNDTFVYLVAGHKQDYGTLLMKRMLKK